jgi:hypothetical protein
MNRTGHDRIAELCNRYTAVGSESTVLRNFRTLACQFILPEFEALGWRRGGLTRALRFPPVYKIRCGRLEALLVCVIHADADSDRRSLIPKLESRSEPYAFVSDFISINAYDTTPAGTQTAFLQRSS